MEKVYEITETQIHELAKRAALAAVAELRDNLQPSREVMTKAQLAQYVGRSVATIDRWMGKGMPYEKKDNEHPTFFRKDVDNWLRSRN